MGQRITVYIDSVNADRLKKYQKEKDRNLSDTVRIIFDAFFRAIERQKKD